MATKPRVFPRRPALDVILEPPSAATFDTRDWNGLPRRCDFCPFAGIVGWWRVTFSEGNRSDQDPEFGRFNEAQVACRMVGTAGHLAADPACTPADWKARARDEVDPPRRRARATEPPSYPLAWPIVAA